MKTESIYFLKTKPRSRLTSNELTVPKIVNAIITIIDNGTAN